MNFLKQKTGTKTARPALGYPNFSHIDEIFVMGRMSAFEAYVVMTSDNGKVLRMAFKIRDFLCSLVGLEKIGGFGGERRDILPAPDEKLDFFMVEEISNELLCLSSSDRHLRVAVKVEAKPVDQERTCIRVATEVCTNNILGRIYMLPVAPVHGIILRQMFSKFK